VFWATIGGMPGPDEELNGEKIGSKLGFENRKYLVGVVKATTGSLFG
jgi:hypothetical protein